MAIKRDHKSKPAPRTSPAMDTRKPVTAHNNEASVGHAVGSRKRKPVITDPANGRDFTGQGGAGEAAGASGPPTTGPSGSGSSSSW
jgi:hypothetical protein